MRGDQPVVLRQRLRVTSNLNRLQRNGERTMDAAYAAGSPVVAVGEEAREPAARFAAATSRELRVASHDGWERSLLEHGANELFFWLPQELLTQECCQRLIRTSVEQNVAVGLLPLPAEAEEREAAVKRELTLARQPRVFPARQAYYDDYTQTASVDGRVTVGAESARAFLAAVGSGVECAIFHGHGNGADMKVGTSVLCVQADESRPADASAGERCLPCQASGPCLRERNPIDSYVGACGVDAGIVVLLACESISTFDSVIASRFTFAHALMRRPSVRALVGSVMAHVTVPAIASTAAQFIDEGGSAGELALCLNAVATLEQASFLCLGDPGARLAVDERRTRDLKDGRSAVGSYEVSGPGASGADAPRSSEPSGASDASARYADGAMSWSTLAVTHVLRRADADSVVSSGARVAMDIGRCALAAGSHVGPFSVDEQVARGLAEIIHHRGGMIFKYWMGLFELVEQVATARPHSCGSALYRLVYERRDVGVSARCVWVCARCGVVGDTSAEVSTLPAILVEADRVRTTSLAESTSGQAWCVVGVEPCGHARAATAPRVIPVGAGRDELTVERPRVSWRGLHWITVVTVYRADYALTRTPAYDHRESQG